MLIDSHCHLNLLKDVEIDNIIKQAIENNVQYLQTICTKLDDLPVILEIAEKYENVFASVGVHPCEVNSHCEALQVLKQSQEILMRLPRQGFAFPRNDAATIIELYNGLRNQDTK